jgi:putative membrane protein
MNSSSPVQLSPRNFFLINGAVCSAAVGFLVWLIYFHEGSPDQSNSSLPAFNALFNSTSAVLLIAGLRAIKKGKRALHKQLMLSALVFSALFLINYIYYHYSQGDTLFQGQGAIRPIYFALLISHVVLSIVVLPMILTSVYLGLTQRFAMHKQLSRWTWAGWMYVSVTGVLVYLMLHVINWSS